MKKNTCKIICNKLFIFFILVILAVTCLNINVYANQYREQTNLDNIDDNRYPLYKSKLKELKQQHPNWSFTILYTGLDWNTVIYNETDAYHGRNLIQNKNGEWLCSTCGDKIYDGSNWKCASVKAVSYYMEPRNYLSTDNIFQFENLSYVDGLYNEAGIETILNGTFMYQKSIRQYYGNDSYTDSKFSTVILEASKNAGVSPYHIASRIKQEVIVSGGGPSNSVTGNVSEYEGYYNFFNIGATAGNGAVERGLKYAKAKGWNSPETSIIEGTKVIANNYISRGQNTLYLQKFDVDSSDNSIYSHQYMQNVQAPLNEGKKVYNAYSNLGMLDSNFNFVIPFYENMPNYYQEEPRDNYSIVTEDVETNTDGVEVKERADASSNTIVTINSWYRMIRIEKNNNWDKIVLNDGTKGYIETSKLNKISLPNTSNDIMCATENVNVRNGPGINGTTIISKISVGEQVTVIEKEKYNVDDYVWDRVQLSNGTIGYVACKYLKFIEINKDEETVRVIANGSLKLREQPTTDSVMLTSLPTGTYLVRLEKNVAYANDLYWDKVKTNNGVVGYVASKYIETINKPDVIEDTSDIIIDTNVNMMSCTPVVSLKNVKEKYSDKAVILKDRDGNEIKEDSQALGTGMQLIVDNTTYTVVKKGDVSGDGVVDARDSLRILKYIVGDYKIEKDSFLKAADINKDGVVDARDSLRILKYTVGEFEIKN